MPKHIRKKRNPAMSAQSESPILTVRGSDWLKMSATRQARVVDRSFRYWRARGFPHYRLSPPEIAAEFSRLGAYDVSEVFAGSEVKGSPVGLRLANYFHPQMWGVKMVGVRSPKERFVDDDKLRSVIRKALRIFTERFAVNASNLRRMLQTYSRTARVSNFRPTAAKAIYFRYSGEGERVLDFSAGYGGRLLGCLTLPREYVGVDPCTAQVRGLRRMLSKLDELVKPMGRATIHQACAEKLLPELPGSSCSLVFSSPPYFETERYSAEPTQSYRKFPAYEQWLDGFLETVLRESHRVLENGGYFVLNVANVNGFKLADDAFRIALKYFHQVETLYLVLGNRPYLREHKLHAHRREPLFVFRKRSPRKSIPTRAARIR